MSEVIEYEGVEYKLGCLVPEVRPMAFAAFADAGPMITRSAAIELVQDKTRVASRTRFSGVKWIVNQRNLGSCNGWAGSGALTRSRVRRGLAYVKLSGEGLYAQINGGRDAGSMLDDGMKALQKNGVCPADMVTQGTYLWKNISIEARAAMYRFKADECYRIDTEDELLAALALGFDTVVAVHVTNAFMKVDQNGLVYPSDGDGNHAVCVDDVRIFNGNVEFDMANSWDLIYGIGGRGYLTWNRHLHRTVTKHCFYAIRTTNDDPLADNPPQLLS